MIIMKGAISVIIFDTCGSFDFFLTSHYLNLHNCDF